ncbi:MAG: hypothetical protein GX330_02460 [Bacteroidales bacterium]|nr:hypothetical protein [Bacteroidales bacterium]
MIKRIINILLKCLLWTTLSIVGLLLIIILVFTIPSVQTYMAHKAADYLSKEMQTEVSIDKLNLNWDLNLVVENLILKDQHGNKLIAACYATCDIPKYDKISHQLSIPNIYAEDAEVLIAKYIEEENINIQFFVDYVKPKKKPKRSIRISLQNLHLKQGKFTFYNEEDADTNVDGHWNYSNIVIDSIYTKMDELLIIGDSLNFKIRELSCKERSGFTINTLKGHLRISSTGLYCLNTTFTTPNQSDIKVDFGFKYNTYSDFSDFNHKIIFDSKLHPSTLSLLDLVYFVPVFKGMDEIVNVESKQVSGSLFELNVENILLTVDKNNYLSGGVKLLGLPYIESTIIAAKINHLQVEPSVIEKINLPNEKNILLPKIAKNIKWLEVEGDYTGYYYDFNAKLNFKTSLGNGSIKNFEFEYDTNQIIYSGDFEVENVELGQLVDYEDVGKISATGKIYANNLNIDTGHIEIKSIEYRNTSIKDIEISGDLHNNELSFSFISPDENIKANINGLINFNSLENEYTFIANIDTFNFSNFNLYRNDSNVRVNINSIIANFQGNTLNNMVGKINISDATYYENNSVYPLGNIKLNVNIDQEQNKNIVLSSKSLNIKTKGKFVYEEMIPMLQNGLTNYLPHALKETEKKVSDKSQHIDIQLNMSDDISLFECLFPAVVLKKGIDIHTHYNKSDHNFRLSANIPSLLVKGQLCENIYVQSHNIENSILLTASCSAFWIANDTLPLLSNIELNTHTKKDTIVYYAKSEDLYNRTLKDIFLQGNFGFTSPLEYFIQVNKGAILIDTSTYVFDSFNHISINKDSIYVKNMGLTSKNKRLRLLGSLSSKHQTKLDLKFNKINLKDFDLIFKKYLIALGGQATGTASIVSNSYGYNIISDVDVQHFSFNNVLLGEFKGHTAWQNENKKLWISAFIIPDEMESQDLTIDVSGYFDPIEKHIDLNGHIQEFNIKTLEPYTHFFANKVEGIGTGFLSFKGPIKTAKLRGNIHLTGGELGIDILKTEYKINQCNIEFVDTGFIFNNITFKDSYNNQGTINGIITHYRLQDWGVDLNINANNILGLNTTYQDNSLFYGKAFGSGEVNIKMDEGVTWITSNIKTEKNTSITVNMDWSKSVNENKFIIFEKEIEKDTLIDTLDYVKPHSSKMGISLNIIATPEANIRVELDPSIGGVLSGNGNGSIRFDLTPDNKFEMYGSYILNSGSFELNLGDILARNFKLEKGGSVSWNGNPSEGVVNVKASYPTRVSISELLEETETSNGYKSIPVSSILYLNGNILNPEFNFGLELTDVDENIKTLVYNAIDTSDREQMVSQTFSMLLLGRFESASVNTVNTGTFVSGLGYSLSDMASHYLNKWVSTLTDKINLGFSYRPGDGSTVTDNYNVQASTNLFDDRLSIQGSVNISDNPNETAAEGNIAGDFIVEYKLTKDGALKIKAFRVSTNYYDNIIIQQTELYSQGLGLSYTINFNKLKDLFISKKKARKTALIF